MTSSSRAGDVGSIPQELRSPHASWPKSQNIKQKQYCHKFNEDFKNLGSHPKKIFKKKRNIKSFRLHDINFHPHSTHVTSISQPLKSNFLNTPRMISLLPSFINLQECIFLPVFPPQVLLGLMPPDMLTSPLYASWFCIYTCSTLLHVRDSNQ